MSPEIPSVNPNSIQDLDVMQSYFMLYQYMKEDFVHKVDFVAALTSNVLVGVAPPPAGTIAGTALFPNIATDVAARAKGLVYKGFVEAGTLAREGLVSGLNVITGS